MTGQQAYPVASLVLWAAVFTLVPRQLPGQEQPASAYSARALKFPEMAAGGACPVSVGDDTVVSSAHQYIFGAGGYFFGSGPVYLALSWKPWERAEAHFKLPTATRGREGYQLKTPWIMRPEYEGEALIRGAQIGADGAAEIRFVEHTQTQPITTEMVLRSSVPGTLVSPSQPQVDRVWGFWPSYIVLPGLGCYAIQIDTEGTSDIVIFEATASD